ncbi:HGxxPAAW family protein [Monashia sp. NPDC004114]
MEEQHEDHGHSVAAWTGVGVILLGSLIAAIGVLLPNLALGIVGAVVIIGGVVSGKVLSMAGYGNKGHAAQDGSVVDAPHESGRGTLGKS